MNKLYLQQYYFRLFYNLIINILQGQSVMILFILVILGLYPLAKFIYNIITSIYFHFKVLNLKQKYGDGWAVVTGATDGIGFGFCQVLASQGYNICLISRNSQKLQAKITQLKQQFNDNVQFMAITANFVQSHSQDFFPPILKQLQKIKPVILVNNVGISELNLIDHQKLQTMRDIVAVNCLPMAYLSSYFIRRCKKQKSKGAIVNISSYSWICPLPYMLVYAGTKAFNDTFSVACSKQTKDDNIDALSVRPMEVISGKVKYKKSLRICTSRECALGSLKYLGCTRYTAGHLKHQILSHMIELLPAKLLDMVGQIEAKKAYQNYGVNINIGEKKQN